MALTTFPVLSRIRHSLTIKQDGQRCPKRRVAQEILMDKQTDKKWTNEQT